MADWANGYDKVVPGKKFYLFTGASAAAREELVSRATEEVTNVVNVFNVDVLTSHFGSVGDSTAYVLRPTEDMDLHIVESYLSGKAIKGSSLILSCASLPESAKSLKSKKPVLVDVSNPHTEKGQKDLVQWVAENWRITPDVARMACERTGFDVGTLMWATKVFEVFTGGKPAVGQMAKRMVEACTPVYQVDDAYLHLLYRHRASALELVRGLDSSQRLGFFRRLESALADLQVLHSALGHDTLSAKALASRTGLHIVKVLELMPLAPRYNPAAILQCRQALQLGLTNYTQPESAVLVTMVWG